MKQPSRKKHGEKVAFNGEFTMKYTKQRETWLPQPKIAPLPHLWHLLFQLGEGEMFNLKSSDFPQIVPC